MPSTADILDSLAAIANGWRPLATLWHSIAAALVVLIVMRQISAYAVGVVLAAMTACVAALAAWAGNWFNAIVFATVTTMLAWHSRQLSSHVPCAVSRWSLIAGLPPLAFAWVYPHFLHDATLWTYAYAAPMGLIPCPSLAAVIGLSLMANLLGSPAWGFMIGMTGLFYGVVGVAGLDVQIDVWLIVAGGAAVAVTLWKHRSAREALLAD